MRRIKASHPDYLEINHHMTMLNLLKNKHVHNRKKSSINYTPEIKGPEYAATIQRIENTIDDWLDGGIFADWMNK